jgi:hypothetical protein
MISTRVNNLNPEKGTKHTRDLIIKRSKELYGYTPEEKSDENMEWMLQNGYVTLKKYKRGPRIRRRARAAHHR